MAKKKQMLPDLTKQDILTPLDISQLGSNGDPCFGIGYDLSTKECKLCGDSELCAFKMSQNLNITRKELEQKKFEVPKKRIRELYRECNGKGQ